MLQFCQYLYDDISHNLNEWISFVEYKDIDITAREKVLTQKLAYLKELISKREECFGENQSFL